MKRVILALISLVVLASCTGNSNADVDSNRAPTPPVVKDNIVVVKINNGEFKVSDANTVLLSENNTDVTTVTISLNDAEIKDDKIGTTYRVTAEALDNNSAAIAHEVIDLGVGDLVKGGQESIALPIVTRDHPQLGKIKFLVNQIAQKPSVKFYIANRKIAFQTDYISTKQATDNIVNLEYVSDLPNDDTGDFLNLPLHLLNASDKIKLNIPQDGFCHFSHNVCAVHYDFIDANNANNSKRSLQHIRSDEPQSNIPSVISLQQSSNIFHGGSEVSQFEVYYCPTPTLYVRSFRNDSVQVGDHLVSGLLYCNLDDVVTTKFVSIRSWADGVYSRDWADFFSITPEYFTLVPNQRHNFWIYVKKSLSSRFYPAFFLVADGGDIQSLVGILHDPVDETANKIRFDMYGGKPEDIARGASSIQHYIELTNETIPIKEGSFHVTLSSDCPQDLILNSPEQDLNSPDYLVGFTIAVNKTATVGKVCHVRIVPPKDMIYRAYFPDDKITVTVKA